jgi:hypothetical protein
MTSTSNLNPIACERAFDSGIPTQQMNDDFLPPAWWSADDISEYYASLAFLMRALVLRGADTDDQIERDAVRMLPAPCAAVTLH